MQSCALVREPPVGVDGATASPLGVRIRANESQHSASAGIRSTATTSRIAVATRESGPGTSFAPCSHAQTADGKFSRELDSKTFATDGIGRSGPQYSARPPTPPRLDKSTCSRNHVAMSRFSALPGVYPALHPAAVFPVPQCFDAALQLRIVHRDDAADRSVELVGGGCSMLDELRAEFADQGDGWLAGSRSLTCSIVPTLRYGLGWVTNST